MGVTVFWAADDPTVTSYALAKSTNKGISYSDLTTISYNTTGGNYEPKTKRFFYADSLGQPGDIYRLIATGSLGVSKPAYIVAPFQEPDTCMIIGYILDALGAVDTKMTVMVEAYGSREDRWVNNPTGVVAQNAHAVAIKNSTITVYPDANGMWQVNLVWGCVARVTIPDLGFVWAFEVPSQDGPVNIRDIPQLRGADMVLFGKATGDSFVLPES